MSTELGYLVQLGRHMMDHETTRAISSRYKGRMSAGRRTYFFDVNENEHGKRYLTIQESKEDGQGGFTKNRLLIPGEHARSFYHAVCDMLKALKDCDDAAQLEPRQAGTAN